MNSFFAFQTKFKELGIPLKKEYRNYTTQQLEDLINNFIKNKPKKKLNLDINNNNNQPSNNNLNEKTAKSIKIDPVNNKNILTSTNTNINSIISTSQNTNTNTNTIPNNIISTNTKNNTSSNTKTNTINNTSMNTNTNTNIITSNKNSETKQLNPNNNRQLPDPFLPVSLNDFNLILNQFNTYRHNKKKREKINKEIPDTSDNYLSQSYIQKNLIKGLSNGSFYKDNTRDNYFNSLPSILKKNLRDFNLKSPAFVFLKDFVEGNHYSEPKIKNKRHYLYIKYGKYDIEDDTININVFFNHLHLVKHYIITYKFSHSDKDYYFSYFYFYLNDSTRINVTGFYDWYYLDTFPNQCMNALLSGTYGNKNLIFLNFSFTKLATNETKKNDFDIITNLRKINLLEYIDLNDLFKHKTYYLKPGESLKQTDREISLIDVEEITDI